MSDELVAPTAERVTQLAAVAGIALVAEDAICTASQLDDATAVALAADSPESKSVATMAAELVDCVGSEIIAHSALLPQAGGIRESSLSCAAAALDDEFVISLVAMGMSDEVLSRGASELAVVTAFSLCLEVDELLERQVSEDS